MLFWMVLEENGYNFEWDRQTEGEPQYKAIIFRGDYATVWFFKAYCFWRTNKARAIWETSFLNCWQKQIATKDENSVLSNFLTM